MMKILNLTKLMVAASLLLLSSSSWAYYTIDSGATIVGNVDNEIAHSNDLTNSGTATETNWVNDVLQSNSYTVSDLSMTGKIDGTTPSDFTQVDGLGNNGIFAIGLTSQPSYFLLKIGIGQKSGLYQYHLFENQTNLDYGVFDLSTLYSDTGTDYTYQIGMISHVSEFGGTTNNVPEPGSIALLGIGLIGLGLLSRRAKKHQA